MHSRHGFNLIPDLMGMEKINLLQKQLNPQIKLPFKFLIYKYFFHVNLTWNINYSEQVFQVGTQSTYSWQVKNGIDTFDVELTKWN